MKIIFLDIDGVLNWRGTKDRVDGFIGFDPDLVAQFNRIIEAHPDAKIVISSSWRHCSAHNKAYKDFKGLKRLLARKGIKGKIIGHTPIFFGNRGRGHEIRESLLLLRDKHPDLTYVILDDDRTGMAPYVQLKKKYSWETDELYEERMAAPQEEDLRPRWVKTSFDGYPIQTTYGGGYEAEPGGLREEFANRAIEILNDKLVEVEPSTEESEWE